MSEKQMFWGNTGGAIFFGLMVLISLMTAKDAGTFRIMVIITEIIGVIILIGAIYSVLQLTSEQKWVPISVIAFIANWLIAAIGYEVGLEKNTDQKWLFFITYYLSLAATIFYEKKAFHRITGGFKLLPACCLFATSMLTVYILGLNMWWLLPF
ncbi:hypothetical protein [Thalassobacillus sp. CUG 92003]|uniref:hypothetical protein n=1 Tax=Thalassobacillus sp. CUG 92003 TaxID=2736641 RepID=UPI0015E7785B|nr:hypothetical protein [Thalassobacillus sp. CUG 92003]